MYPHYFWCHQNFCWCGAVHLHCPPRYCQQHFCQSRPQDAFSSKENVDEIKKCRSTNSLGYFVDEPDELEGTERKVEHSVEIAEVEEKIVKNQKKIIGKAKKYRKT